MAGQPVTVLTEISACAAGASPACLGTADESRTVISYDDVNLRPAGVETRSGNGSGTGALSATTSFGYDAYGDVTSIDGPLPGADDTSYLRYDAARRPVGAISPDPDGPGTGPDHALKRRAQRVSYRPDGQASAVETGTVEGTGDADWAAMTVLEGVTTDYDSDNRPAVQRLISGSATYALAQTSYDALGRVRCVAQRMNPAEFAAAALPADACTLDSQGSFGPDRIARTSYDAAGQATKMETGVGTAAAADEATATYTANGQVETLTDGEGNRTTYAYDAFDRLWRTSMPSTTQGAGTSSTSDYEELGYDANGNITARRLRDGRSIAYSYDALDRLTRRDIPEGAYGEFDVAYAYDLLGRLTSATSDSSQIVSYGYDALGRTLTETGPMGTKTMQYDLAGRLTRLAWPDSFAVDYVRDVIGEVVAIRESGAAAASACTGATACELARYAYDDGGRRTSVTRGNGTSTSYDYDAIDRLTSLTQDLAGTANDLTLGLSYNPAAQIVQSARSNDAYSFIQANGSAADTANGLNQITQHGTVSLGHDTRGNLSSDGARSYAYTSENRLAAAGTSLIFYDPVGRIHQFYHYDGTAEHYTRFDNLGGTIIAELDLVSQTTQRYVPGPDIDEPLVWYQGSGTSTRRWLHADERGSVVAVSDGGGNLYGNANRYDEYGNVQGTPTGRFGYTGQPWLPELGLSYNRNRIYNPGLGRFLQTDPIGYDGGVNLYAYVLNDPVNFVDPSGLGEVCWYVDATTDDGHGGVIVQSRKVCYDLPDIGVLTWGDWTLTFPRIPLPDIVCAPVGFTVTGVGPNQANTRRETAISQEEGRNIDPRGGGVAINPNNFGVPTVTGTRREVFANMRLYPAWNQAGGPSYVSAMPLGLPSTGPYRAIDVIPINQQHPGNQIDLYRYSNQNQAFQSTRSVPMTVTIPRNEEGITCPR